MRPDSQQMLWFTQVAVDRLADAAYWVRSDAGIMYVNNAACELLGYTKEELIAKFIYEVNPDISRETWPAVWEQLRKTGRRTFETRHQAKDGRIIPVEISSNLLELDGKEYACAFARDITERKRMELRLNQAEKMEAIGRLAGGVAHDFNNQLMGMMGSAELLREEVKGNLTALELVDDLVMAVQRSADLTAHLLAFARQGKYRSEPVNVHDLIGEVVLVLSRSIDKRITVIQDLAAPRPLTLGEPSQLQNTVMNLALNARDAMPQGGTLSFATREVELGDQACAGFPFDIRPGRFVQLIVSDSGSGMDEATQRRIFEPFFTTKEQGRGTGLGMAAVFGTVNSHHGAVEVRSAVGAGTQVSVYLPLHDAEAQVRPPSVQPTALHRALRILVVDDEPIVRKVAQRLLAGLGCEVLLCENGREALTCYQAAGDTVDLVILDIAMPVMGGRETFAGLRAIDPEVKVLVSTGYSLDSEAQAILDAGAAGFLQKPFERSELVAALKRIIQEP